MNFIQNHSEPNHLILVWQSPFLDGGAKERKRYSVGDLWRDGNDATLRYRDDEETAVAKALGYTGYPAFRLDTRLHSGVLSAFMRRLPPRDRSDFAMYLERFRIADNNISEFSLLGYTEAKLPTDGFSLVDPLTESSFPSDFFLEIVSYRRNLEVGKEILIGDHLDVVPEPENDKDPNAVRFMWNGNLVGYVNRVQAPAVKSWVGTRSIRCCFERRNGTVDYPRAYAFLRAT